eukprot:TRINITY_DN12317_c0_g1_i1.p1 TRINITY_DN12317_c0_g1~~TRINITY_DN12317_c0_g1_i1.p1  ORF type:complete len:342 (+),score=24.55 TRINITY_DN12317_c0_g1_i1:242-1267(+)
MRVFRMGKMVSLRSGLGVHFRVVTIFLLAVVHVSFGCMLECQFLVPSVCYKNTSLGGCCHGDSGRGRIRSESSCVGCDKPGSNMFRWLCDSCHQDSACHGMTRIDSGSGECAARNCKGGCLQDGKCDQRVEELSCLNKSFDAIWCPPCDANLWRICHVFSPCYAWPHGCCSKQGGGCPRPPYHIRGTGGDCGSCAAVLPICDACFPQSICSSHYDSEYETPTDVFPPFGRCPDNTAVLTSLTTSGMATTARASATTVVANASTPRAQASTWLRASTSFTRTSSVVGAWTSNGDTSTSIGAFGVSGSNKVDLDLTSFALSGRRIGGTSLVFMACASVWAVAH